MNELILKRLAEESGFLNDVTKFEAFAVLLVKECAELCADIDGGENMFSRAIRKQFGVEE